MRVTTLFRKLISVTSLFFVTGVWLDPRGLVLEVRPARRKPRCGRCGRRAPGYDRRKLCYWRHLALGRFALWLAYAPRRVECPGCGVLTEEVPWACSGSRFTWEFEEMTAYLAQITDRTTVTKMMGVAWETAGRIVERVIERRLDSSRLEDLRAIGVDEFSYRKRHHYVTVVVDHDRRRIVWAKEGRSYEVLKSFFQELGIDRCFNIKTVTIDMAAGYQKAIEEWLAWASRSRLKPFVRVARTIRKHFEGVVAYVQTRLTNGLVEGINNKLRMVARRAFGFHGPGPLIGMLFLTCGGIQLDPPLPSPTNT